MKGFKHFIAEMVMSASEAKSILELGDTWTDEEFKLAFRRASRKHHPDRGGTTEMMQKVNRAKEILQKESPKSQSKPNIWEAIKQKQEAAQKFILKDLESYIVFSNFTQYFQQVFGEPFTMVKKTERQYESDSVVLNYEIFNDSRNNFYSIVLYVNVTEFINQQKTLSGELSISETPYSVSIDGFSFINNRKTKISNTPWKKTHQTQDFADPNIIFPKEKLIKKNKRKFSKRDVEAALQSLGVVWSNGGSAFVPLSDGHYLNLQRNVFLGTPSWTVYGVFSKMNYTFKSVFRFVYSFPENEEFIDQIRKFSKMSGREVADLIFNLKDKS